MTLNIANADRELVPIPLPKPATQTPVYHYTGANGLLGILQTHRLWASSTRALNDVSELRYGLEVFRDSAEGHGGNASARLRQLLGDGGFAALGRRLYVFSASKDGDSLSQWIGYGGRQGYALELDPAAELKWEDAPSEPPQWDSIYNLWGSLPNWYEVIYGRAEQIQLVTEMLEYLDDHGLGDNLRTVFTCTAPFLPIFKHAAFESEREVRFVSPPQPGRH